MNKMKYQSQEPSLLVSTGTRRVVQGSTTHPTPSSSAFYYSKSTVKLFHGTQWNHSLLSVISTEYILA